MAQALTTSPRTRRLYVGTSAARGSSAKLTLIGPDEDDEEGGGA